jgi:hypothetical protein
MAVIPFSGVIRVAEVNVGVLVISAMSAVGILGIILGGWSSNSHYSLLGGLRSAAQLVSYEVALALALLSGVMAAGSLNMAEIVRNQQERGLWFVFDNFGFMIVPFFIYFVAAIAETNRAPFDLPEAESELVAGFHTEYSGIRWGLYMLSEYANMYVVGSVAVTLFRHLGLLSPSQVRSDGRKAEWVAALQRLRAPEEERYRQQPTCLRHTQRQTLQRQQMASRRLPQQNHRRQRHTRRDRVNRRVTPRRNQALQARPEPFPHHPAVLQEEQKR